jgi:probable F420-dependent oxidoreductase
MDAAVAEVPGDGNAQPNGCANLLRVTPLRYRFGIAGLPASLPELRQAVQRYEEVGFDFVAKGDHIGGLSPFPLLTAAAAVSERVRLRTYVLNASFWNPMLLARDAATLDQVSAGRLELGLGAGTVKSEFDTAGIPWQGSNARIERMRETLTGVRRALTDSAHEPHSVQRPVPLLVGAMSRPGLAVAVECAEIIAFGAVRHKPGHPPGTLTAATAEETDELVAAVRRQAGTRAFESDVLLQSVELGKDPLAAARAFLGRDGENEDPLVWAESPCVLFARTALDAAAEVERRRERWGFTSITTFASSSDALAAVARELR